MLRGTGASEGIGIGRILNLDTKELELSEKSKPKTSFTVEAELANVEKAAEDFISETRDLSKRLLKKGLESEAEIMNSHISLVEDRFLKEQINQAVMSGKTACEAICESFDEMINLFSDSDDEIIRQRALDFQDIRQRLLGKLTDSQELSDMDFSGRILFMEEVTPSFAALIEKDRVEGIVSVSGGYTSHAAILLRAKEIPAVFGVKTKEDVADDLFAVIDGEEGRVILDPAEEIIEEYENKQKIKNKILELKDYYILEETKTACGVRKEIYANAADLTQAKAAHGMGAGGIGLFRSEFLYMNDKLPTEEEQLRTYKSLGKLFAESEVIIRTLDAGGDKPCKSLNFPKEDNPFLGQRGIRYCLNNTEIFKTQLRSILRAAYKSNIKISLPMVTAVSEVIETKALIAECISELEQEGLDCNKDIKLGVMIETPAACIMADRLAEVCDFFSIGTNDLSGYVTAADRGNAKVSRLCSPFEPALLRLMKHVCESAHEKNIEVSICGEAASDIRLLPLLLSFGIDKFSVSSERIWRLRREISRWKITDADIVSEKVMFMTAEAEVEKYLTELQEGGKGNEY